MIFLEARSTGPINRRQNVASVWLPPLFCVREIPDSNLGPETGYTDWGFSSFSCPPPPRKMAGVVPQIRPWQLHPTSSPIQNLPNILSRYAQTFYLDGSTLYLSYSFQNKMCHKSKTNRPRNQVYIDFFPLFFCIQQAFKWCCVFQKHPV
jgi:hypothetical protein